MEYDFFHIRAVLPSCDGEKSEERERDEILSRGIKYIPEGCNQ